MSRITRASITKPSQDTRQPSSIFDGLRFPNTSYELRVKFDEWNVLNSNRVEIKSLFVGIVKLPFTNIVIRKYLDPCHKTYEEYFKPTIANDRKYWYMNDDEWQTLKDKLVFEYTHEMTQFNINYFFTGALDPNIRYGKVIALTYDEVEPNMKCNALYLTKKSENDVLKISPGYRFIGRNNGDLSGYSYRPYGFRHDEI